MGFVFTSRRQEKESITGGNMCLNLPDPRQRQVRAAGLFLGDVRKTVPVAMTGGVQGARCCHFFILHS